MDVNKNLIKKLWICGILINLTIVTGCSKDTSVIHNQTNNTPSDVTSNNHILIAYFSRVGNTDFPSDIDASSSASILKRGNEIVGNTQYLAEIIQQNTGGDLFFMKTIEPYPADYDETDMRGKDENANRTKVQLDNHITNLNDYDTIFLGYPNWYYDMPMALYAFLEEYDLSGKTIIPFNTNGGSGFSNSIQQIQTLEPQANVVTNGYTINHHKISNLDIASVQEWLQSLPWKDRS